MCRSIFVTIWTVILSRWNENICVYVLAVYLSFFGYRADYWEINMSSPIYDCVNKIG